MHLTVRGTPYLYYGEEIGMRNISIPYSQIQDPPGKRYWPLFKAVMASVHRCRDARPFAGFSSVEPWLPVHPNYKVRNVSNQSETPASLLSFYKSLIALRREHPALHAGKLSMIDTGDALPSALHLLTRPCWWCSISPGVCKALPSQLRNSIIGISSLPATNR